MTGYFQNEFGAGTLSQITWAHAVNGQARLAACLNDGSTMFIEADVILSKNGTPIMAHPPVTESDLTLESMLRQLQSSKQGIKLDFKSAAAVPKALRLLNQIGLTQPVILNADILQGNGAEPPAVPAESFISLCSEGFPEGILSLSWTTIPDVPYTAENVDEMMRTVSKLDTVLFPIRTSSAQKSWRQLVRLIPADKPGWALSFWNTKYEVPTSDLIEWLKSTVPPDRAMYDIIKL